MNPDLLHGFSLEQFDIDPVRGEVRGPRGAQHLAPKAMEVLLCLASEPGELVTRRILLQHVWGRDKGSPEALSRAVSEIRHALGDQADDPRFVQTLPGRGYRLLVQPRTRPAPASEPAGEPGLFENLLQRGVIKTGVAYTVLGWLIIQVVDVVFDQLHLPAWAGTFVTLLVIAGFPIALALSWFLEFRDGRAVLDKGAQHDSRTRQFSRTYLSVIGAMLIAAGAVYVYDRNIGLPVPAEPAPPMVAAEPVLPPVQDNSIAVLPFLNLDGSDQTQIFSNGLVDDVITQLSRVPGLLVSSRGDSFTLEPNSASQKVRDRLRVALYLEGSVQIAGERMRIIVQMIDSATGFHVLSRSFDRPLQDFFDIRDEITRLTVGNVRVALPPETRAAAEGLSDDPSLDVYVLYRRGVEASLLPRSVENLETALRWYDAALELDADYAAALAGKCWAYVDLYPETDDAQYIEAAEQSCGRALQLNPNLDIVHTALGELYSATGRYDRAEESFRAAYAIDPNSVAALAGLGNIARLQRRPDEAEERLRQAIGLHPGDWSAYNSLGFFLYRSGRYGEAADQYEYVVGLDPDNAIGWTNLAAARMLDGDFESALAASRRLLEFGAMQSTYSNMGLMYYYLGRAEESIEAMRQSVELAPNDHLAWSNLGDALGLGGQGEEARAAFEKAEGLARAALEVNPSDAPVLMDMAWIQAMLGRPAEARDLIDRSLSLSPDDPYGYYYSGLIHVRAGQPDRALDDFESALEHGYPVNMLVQDPQLAALRDSERFRGIVSAGEAD